MWSSLCLQMPQHPTEPGHHQAQYWSHIYRQVSNIRRTLAGNKIVHHSNVVRASPVGAAPTTIFILDLTPGFIGLGKGNCKTRRETIKFLGFGASYIRDFTVDILCSVPWLSMIWICFWSWLRWYYSKWHPWSLEITTSREEASSDASTLLDLWQKWIYCQPRLEGLQNYKLPSQWQR